MAGTNRNQVDRREKNHGYYDFSLLFLTIFLAGFGIIMIYSSSSYKAQITFQDAGHFMKRQLYAVIAGIGVMVLISKIDYRILIKKLPVIRLRPVTLGYIVAFGLQLLVLLLPGGDYNGAKRWIELPGGLTFQPSELSKVVVIVSVAYLVHLAPRQLDRIGGFLRIMIYMTPLIGLIVKENLSTAIVVTAITVGICFVASKKKWYFVLFAVVFAAGILAFIYLGPMLSKDLGFRLSRLDAWRNVETHPMGFQILQGLYAIASGGIFGKGLGQSMQKLGFIPEAYNDMIFSIICEELGLFGAVAIILLFVLLIWRIFIISISAPDLYGGLLCAGVLVHIAVQVIINIAVVTSSIPSTGIPLPFISYGGTSVAILLAEMGLVLSVSNQIKYER